MFYGKGDVCDWPVAKNNITIITIVTISYDVFNSRKSFGGIFVILRN
jgi:hypothetical protein